MKKIASLILVASVGCAQVHANTPAAVQTGIDCVKQDLGQTVAGALDSLLMTVVEIIFTGGSTWESDLAALAAKYGSDAISCAEKIAKVLFQTAPTTPSTSDAIETPYDRAVKVLQGKSFK